MSMSLKYEMPKSLKCEPASEPMQVNQWKVFDAYVEDIGKQ